MNIFKKIKSWFVKEKQEAVFEPLPHVPLKPVKSESIPLSQLDIKRNRIKAWRNKTIRKKAHRLPLAKMMNPEKYF